jgi:hypothetical protein
MAGVFVIKGNDASVAFDAAGYPRKSDSVHDHLRSGGMKPRTVNVSINLNTGDFVLVLPRNFDYVGDEATAVIEMLPRVRSTETVASDAFD